jgi:hypothetical protein
MPKFYCVHCGQHIDAPDTMSGTQTTCPTCGGEIDVPTKPKITTAKPGQLEEEGQTHERAVRASELDHKPGQFAQRARGQDFQKIIRSSIIAFALFFLEGTLTNTGWASEIFVASLAGACFSLISFGLTLAAAAAVGGGILTVWRKPFFRSFSNIYSLAILSVSALLLVGSFLRLGSPY